MGNAVVDNGQEQSGLPTSWSLVHLPEIAEINPTLDKRDIDDNLLVSFVPMPAVEAETGHIDVNAQRKFTEVKKGYTGFLEGDVLFAKITPCMENGKMAVVPALQNGIGFGSTEFHVLRVYGDISPQYLYYFVSSKQFRMIAERNMTGAVGQRRVTTHYLNESEIPLPPTNEQQRIVAKIEELFSELDKGMENLRTAQQQLKVYRQALLKHAFEGKLTTDWRAQNPDKLESADALLARIQQEREAGYQRQLKDWQAAQRAWEANGKTGSKPSKPKAPKALPSLTAEKLPNNWITLPVDLIFEIEDGDRGEHYPTKGDFSNVGHCLFLNAKNVTKRGFLFKETSFISEKKHQALRKGSLKRGDIIFTSRGTLGNIAIYNEKTPYEHVRINSGMFIIRNYSDMFLPDFIYRYLTSPDITSQIDKLQSGTAQPQLPIREFKSFRFVFPGKPEQEQIILVIEEKLSLLDQLEQTITHSLQQAEALRQSILKKAFSGQLVAQDPNDEPASVLLERIRAERAAQPKARGRKARAST